MLVKELQALALDIRVLDKNGEEIQLSTLCNEDDGHKYSGKPLDMSLFEDDMQSSDDEFKDAFQFEDEEGNIIDDFAGDAFDDGEEY